jgi:hypothetical protein
MFSLTGVPLSSIGLGLVTVSVIRGPYCLGPPQYGHLSTVVGISVPQYLQLTLATSLITTCS